MPEFHGLRWVFFAVVSGWFRGAFYPGRPRAQKVSYIYPIGIMITILILRTMIMLRLIPSLYWFLLAYYYHSCYRYYYRSPPSPIYMPMTMRVPSWEVYSYCIYIYYRYTYIYTYIHISIYNHICITPSPPPQFHAPPVLRTASPRPLCGQPGPYGAGAPSPRPSAGGPRAAPPPLSPSPPSSTPGPSTGSPALVVQALAPPRPLAAELYGELYW